MTERTLNPASPQVFSLAVNPPLVDSIKLQGKAMAGFLVYPHKVSLMFADESKTLFEWFVSADKVRWVQNYRYERICVHSEGASIYDVCIRNTPILPTNIIQILGTDRKGSKYPKLRVANDSRPGR